MTGVEEQQKLLSLKLRLVNGDLSIDSELQRGTIIHARVPFNSDSESRRAAGLGFSGFEFSVGKLFCLPATQWCAPLRIFGAYLCNSW